MGTNYWLMVAQHGTEFATEIWIRHDGKPWMAARFIGTLAFSAEVRAFAPAFAAFVLNGLNTSGSGEFKIR
jgi:hypothetical protein